MTTVGKILVVLHLVLSVMFMAFAGAIFTAQTNWKATNAATAASLATANNKMKEMQAESDKIVSDLKDTKTRLDNEIVTLKGLNTALDSQVKTLNSDNLQVRKDADQQRDLNSLNSTEATERKTEADLQRSKNGELYLSREEYVAKLNETEDERFKLAIQMQQVSEKYDQLLNDYKIMKSYLASKDLTTDPKQMIVQTAPPPPLDGRVTEVRKAQRGSREFVQISLGSDAGLVPGHRLTVFRGNDFLGEIVLSAVEADRSVGYVSRRDKNATFQVDDEVTTRY